MSNTVASRLGHVRNMDGQYEGNNDLIINQEITNQVNKKVNDDCIEKKTTSNKKLILKYNSKNKSYN